MISLLFFKVIAKKQVIANNREGVRPSRSPLNSSLEYHFQIKKMSKKTLDLHFLTLLTLETLKRNIGSHVQNML